MDAIEHEFNQMKLEWAEFFDTRNQSTRALIHGLEVILAQLRHAYTQLKNESVVDQKQFADGLIGPQVSNLEKMVVILQKYLDACEDIK